MCLPVIVKFQVLRDWTRARLRHDSGDRSVLSFNLIASQTILYIYSLPLYQTINICDATFVTVDFGNGWYTLTYYVSKKKKLDVTTWYQSLGLSDSSARVVCLDLNLGSK